MRSGGQSGRARRERSRGPRGNRAPFEPAETAGGEPPGPGTRCDSCPRTGPGRYQRVAARSRRLCAADPPAGSLCTPSIPMTASSATISVADQIRVSARAPPFQARTAQTSGNAISTVRPNGLHRTRRPCLLTGEGATDRCPGSFERCSERNPDRVSLPLLIAVSVSSAGPSGSCGCLSCFTPVFSSCRRPRRPAPRARRQGPCRLITYVAARGKGCEQRFPLDRIGRPYAGRESAGMKLRRAAANSWPWSPGAGSGDPRRRDPSRSAKRPMNRSDSAVARPSVAAKTFEGACDRIPGCRAQRCCFRQGLPASSSSAWAPALAESGAASSRSGIRRRAAGCSAR